MDEAKSHGKIESESYDNDLYQIDNKSIYDKKEKTEWCKGAFESKLENTDEIKIQNSMTCIYGSKVNKWD